MSSEIIKPEETGITKQKSSISEVLFYAEHAYRSGRYKDLPNVSAAIMILKTGRDIGFTDSASLSNINFIQGKISLSGNAQWSLVLRNLEYRKSHVVLDSPDKCILRFIREIQNPDGTLERILDKQHTWDETDNQRAQLSSGPVHKKFPRALKFNRAVSSGFKMYAAHLGMGYVFYTPDELGAEIDSEGEFVSSPVPITVLPEKNLLREEVKGLLEEAQISLEEAASALGIQPGDLEDPIEADMPNIRHLCQMRKEMLTLNPSPNK